MPKVYECKMICEVTVNIKADSEEDAQWWLQTHDIDVIKELTSAYGIEWSEEVVGETDEEIGIDISLE